jgi:succinate dehydrogenase/fumarate reductase cytochrome b subunit
MRLILKEPPNYLKHSNQIQFSLHSIFGVQIHCFVLCSHNLDNHMGNEGAIKLSEALKSNSSLVALNLTGDILLASFHSHSNRF